MRCCVSLVVDFIFTGVRHIRVLYYDGLKVPEDLGNQMQDPDGTYPGTHSDGNYNLNFERFQPFMRRAIDLVTTGFPIPVPMYDNHSPLARATVRVFNSFPEIAKRGSYLYLATLSGDGLIMDPESVFVGSKWWHSPKPMPADIHEVISGKKGVPAGPDINEVSGRSLQEFIADRPRWSKFVKGSSWHHY